MGAHSGGNIPEELSQQVPDAVLDVLPPKAGAQESHTAVNVVSHSAGGDNTVIGIHGGHTADGEAVPPVDIRHGQGILHDPRQMSHIPHLFYARVSLDGGDELSAGVDPPRHPHTAGFGYFPEKFADLPHITHLTLPSPINHHTSRIIVARQPSSVSLTSNWW